MNDPDAEVSVSDKNEIPGGEIVDPNSAAAEDAEAAHANDGLIAAENQDPGDSPRGEPALGAGIEGPAEAGDISGPPAAPPPISQLEDLAQRHPIGQGDLLMRVHALEAHVKALLSLWPR